MKTIHIGEKIKKELYRQKLSPTMFAVELGLTRTVVYNIFTRPAINTELLQKVSKILNHDFFKYYSATLK